MIIGVGKDDVAIAVRLKLLETRKSGVQGRSSIAAESMCGSCKSTNNTILSQFGASKGVAGEEYLEGYDYGGLIHRTVLV